MPASSLIVIGASAGGMPALTRLAGQLPAALPSAVLAVQHFPAVMDGRYLVERLARHTALRCRLAESGDPVENATLYLARPDHHLLVKDEKLLITRGPRENRFRPAVDALFRSAAVNYGPAVTGVVLTGLLHDGAAGLEFIKRCGGRAVVQDPREAEFPDMPAAALRAVDVDHVAPVAGMGALLAELAEQMNSTKTTVMIPEDLKQEAAIAERALGSTGDVERLGKLAPITCPDCGGSLWEMEHGKVLRYRCHTGHAFTAGALLQSGRQELEETLWVALRMMEERKILLSSMAARERNPWPLHEEERLEEIKKHIDRLRGFLLNGLDGRLREAAATVPEEEVTGSI